MRATLLSAVMLFACGPRHMVADAGPEDAGEDAGVDAGRQRGDDPDAGWQLALALPADAGATTRWGVSTSMALDQFQQPMIAAIIVDPNSDGVNQDNRLVFTRWDGVAHAYSAPVTIEVLGDIDVAHPKRQVSLARDAVTGQLGVVYPNESGAIRHAWSDDEGAHWSQETVSTTTGTGPRSNPVLGLRGAQLDVAYVQDGQVVHRVRTGSGAFQEMDLGPAAPDWPIAMQLPSAGVAAIAYFNQDDAGVTLSYAQGGSPQVITSSTAAIDKVPSVSLDLTNDVPRVAYHLPSATDADGQLWYSKATDLTGASWSTPVALPRNGPTGMLDGTQWYQAIAVDSAGKLAVVGNFQNRTATLSQQCGGPKLGFSTDGTTWAVCHPPEAGSVLDYTFNFAGWWLNMASHRPGKVTIALDYETRGSLKIGAGVAVYRQP